jgi:hypothetical protein
MAHTYYALPQSIGFREACKNHGRIVNTGPLGSFIINAMGNNRHEYIDNYLNCWSFSAKYNTCWFSTGFSTPLSETQITFIKDLPSCHIPRIDILREYIALQRDNAALKKKITALEEEINSVKKQRMPTDVLSVS